MRFLLTSVLLAWAAIGFSQDVEAGIYFGGVVYSGDLSPKVLPRYTRFVEPMGGVVFRYRSKGILGVRASLYYGNLRGDDTRSAYPDRKLSFETSVLEFAAVGEWYLIPDNFLGDPPRCTPYFFLGVNFFRFDPEAQFESGYLALQPVGTEGQGLEGYEPPYNRNQIGIPFGFGVRYQISKRGALSLELCARKLFTDHLDDVTGAYLDYTQIYEEKGELAARLSRPSVNPDDIQYVSNIYRRGGDRFDSFGSVGISFTYHLGR